MPRVVAVYKEEARRNILEKAAGVFARNGYSSTTMDDIAGELGVSKGAVYQYFTSKDELFRELCGAAAKVVEERLRENFEGPDLRKSAERYMNAEVDRFRARGILMFEALAQAPRNPSISSMLENNYSTVLEVMKRFLAKLKEEGMLKKEADPETVAEQIIALRHGVLATVMMGADREEALKVWMNGFESIVGRFIRDGN